MSTGGKLSIPTSPASRRQGKPSSFSLDARQNLVTYLECIRDMQAVLAKQSQNQDQLYEDKLRVMANLKQSFEALCNGTQEEDEQQMYKQAPRKRR